MKEKHSTEMCPMINLFLDALTAGVRDIFVDPVILVDRVKKCRREKDVLAKSVVTEVRGGHVKAQSNQQPSKPLFQ